MVVLGLALKAAKKLVKSKAIKKVAGKAVGAAKSVLGMKGKAVGKRRGRGLNINRYVKRIIKAKLDGRVLREKFKVVNMLK